MPGKRWKLAISSDCWHCSECRREIPPETEFYLLDDNKGVARCGQCQREHEIRRENSRRIDALTAHQYRDALLALNRERKITLKHREMLSIQCQAPRHKLSAGQLARKAQLAGAAVVNAQYGKLGHLLWDRLPLLEPPPARSGEGRWIGVIEPCWKKIGRHYEGTMHPSLARALKQIGWCSAAPERSSR